jgi:SpoVK/Ycf46/Vps4 family AAA+-type ATPase
MLNLTNYQKAGYAMVFVETMEIKRAIRSIQIDEPFKKKIWSPIRGLIEDYHNFSLDTPMQPIQLLDLTVGKTTDNQGKIVFQESFDEFIEAFDAVQTILDYYEMLKANATMLVIVGSNSDAIPSKLKEFIPVEEFRMPNEDEIKKIAESIAESSIEALGSKFADKFKVTGEIIEACKGLTWEEIENALAKSAVETRSFDFRHIMDRKKQVVKQTGFMQFIEPEPIENLGGLQKFKDYWNLRAEPFLNDDSIKPKVRAVLVAGYPGTGKSLGAKVLASILNWPIVMLDIGSTKEGIVGETEKKIRYATYTIDSIGRVIVLVDEIEKFVGGNQGQGSTTSGVDEGVLGHLLTWMQERQSEGILYGTANNLDVLPPEFKRAGGRWDTIFFVNLPNSNEVNDIVNIMNRRYKSKLPTDDHFCKGLHEKGWSGAEIEQLAKDSHYEKMAEAINNIPILSQHEQKKFERTRELAKMYRWANSEGDDVNIHKAVIKKPRKLKLN